MTGYYVRFAGIRGLCGLILIEFTIFSNSEGKVCDLKPSIKKGATYYRSMTPWGKWLDMPCPPGTVFVQEKCSCAHPWQRQSKLINVLTTVEPEERTSAPPVREEDDVQAMDRKVKKDDGIQAMDRKVKENDGIQAMDRKLMDSIKTSTSLPQTSSVILTTIKATVNNENGGSPYTTQPSPTGESLPPATSQPSPTGESLPPSTKSPEEISSKPSSTAIPIIKSTQPTLHSSFSTKTNNQVADDTEKMKSNQTDDDVTSFLLSELSVVGDFSTLIALPSPSAKSTPAMFLDLTTKVRTPSPKNSMTESAAMTSFKSMTSDTALSSPPSIKTSAAGSTTSGTTAADTGGCELREVKGDVTSYMGYVNDDVGWIQFQCPMGQEFSADICWCFDPKKTTQSISTFIPPDCRYFKEGKTSFKEYIDFLQSWVYSECSDGYEFSQLRCGCVLAGTLPDAEKVIEKVQNGDDDNKRTVPPTSTVKIPNGCLNVAEGSISFKTYVSDLGAWIYSDCPSGAYFDQAMCGCVTPEEKAKNECPYRSYGEASYTHYIAAINDNVYYQCPDNHVFNEVLCTCIAKGSSQWIHHRRRTTRSPQFITPSVTKPFKHGKVPQNCNKIGDSMTSYKEYIDILRDWVYSDCGVGEIFVQEKCGCFRGDDTKAQPDLDQKSSTTVAPVAKGCDKEATGRASFKTFVKVINDWAYSDCPSKYVFNQTQCKCVIDDPHTQESHEHSVNNLHSVQALNKSSKVVTNGTVDTNQPKMVDTNDVSVDTNQSKISTVSLSTSFGANTKMRKKHDEKDGDESSKKTSPIAPRMFRHAKLVKVLKQLNSKYNLSQSIDSACTSVPTGKSSFKKFVADLNDWVFADCQDNFVFSVDHCDCVPNGDDVIPQDVTKVATIKTTEVPVMVTNPDCQYEASGAGYRKYISQLGDWVYYECPSGKSFSIAKCDCIGSGVIGSGCVYEKAGDGQYRRYVQQLDQWIYYQCPTRQSFSEDTCQCITEGVDPNINREKLEPGTNCMSRPSDIGKEYFVMSFPSFGDILYTCEFGYLYSPERCQCVPKNIAVDDSAKKPVTSRSCALQESDKGPGYFRMQISDQQWIDLSCPRNERFSADRCSCLPA